MLLKKMIAAGLIAVATFAAVPANAATLDLKFPYHGQVPGWSHAPHGPRHGHDRLSPQQVRWVLQRHGYRSINFLDRRGPVYQVRAHKRHRAYILVVSARSGEILNRHPLRRGWH